MTWYAEVVGTGPAPTKDYDELAVTYTGLALTCGTSQHNAFEERPDGTWMARFSGGSGMALDDYELELTRARAGTISVFAQLVPHGVTKATVNGQIAVKKVTQDLGSDPSQPGPTTFGVLLG